MTDLNRIATPEERRAAIDTVENDNRFSDTPTFGETALGFVVAMRTVGGLPRDKRRAVIRAAATVTEQLVIDRLYGKEES